MGDEEKDANKVIEEFNNKKSEIIRDPIVCLARSSFFINCLAYSCDSVNFDSNPIIIFLC